MEDKNAPNSSSDSNPPEARTAEDEKNAQGSDPESGGQKLPYPKAVFFIVINEFCERFTFYGMRTVLSLYLRNELGFGESTATVIYHLFIMICYFFPLVGAIIADSYWGKYKTILYLSMVYAVGNVVVSSSAFPDLSSAAVPLTMVGLVLIALGTGGIKPCVSAFGGDQFILPQQQVQLTKFFSLFYFTINAGSFISTFLTPVLRETQCFGQDNCYALAFGVPAVLMIIAIIVYFLGRNFYKITKPEGNVIVNVSKCIWHAITKGKKTTGDHWLDKAEDKYDKGFINDIKATLRVLYLYLPLPFFWALFDQQGSRWTFQATRMNGEIGNFIIQADQMQVVNPVLILIFIPLFDTVLYPFLAKIKLLRRPLQRLTTGGLLAAVAFLVSALLEQRLEHTYAVLPKPGSGHIRMYNGLPGNMTVMFEEPKMDPFVIPELDFWQKYNIPIDGEAKFKLTYTVNEVKKSQSINAFDNSVTSYIFTPEKVFEIRNDDEDKSQRGYAKVMFIISSLYKERNVTLSCKKDKKFTLTKEVPFTEFTEFKTCDLTNVEVDNTPVLTKIKLSQGGVYVVLISDNKDRPEGNFLTVIEPNSMSILWLLPQFIIITAGEVMFSITGLEFSFTQAPESMKSLLQAAWLLTVAVGNLIVVIISQAKIFDSQFHEFLLFAGLMALDMIIFALMALGYRYVEVESKNADKPEENKAEKNSEEGNSQNHKE